MSTSRETPCIQGAAEIVKHFKILVMSLSAKVLRSAGICT